MRAQNSHRKLNHEHIVLILAGVLFAGFATFLPGFARVGNLLSLVQTVAIVGTLGIAMAIVIIGRGIDLSLIAVMVMPVAWLLWQVQNGVPLPTAALLAFSLAVAVGLCNGWLIAYAEVPPIFATIATGTTTYGAVQFFLVPTDIVPFPQQLEWLSHFWNSDFHGVPRVVIFFALVAFIVWLMLRFTRLGRFIYAIGDNPSAARNAGLPVRPMLLLQYTIAAVIAVVTGLVLAGTVGSASTRSFNSTMVYDVILVVVLGGIGLSGGKGRVRNVLIGTVLIGILVNAMTIMDLSYSIQNLVKAAVLLAAIAVDSVINPRDEQVSQQGDI